MRTESRSESSDGCEPAGQGHRFSRRNTQAAQAATLFVAALFTTAQLKALDDLCPDCCFYPVYGETIGVAAGANGPGGPGGPLNGGPGGGPFGPSGPHAPIYDKHRLSAQNDSALLEALWLRQSPGGAVMHNPETEDLGGGQYLHRAALMIGGPTTGLPPTVVGTEEAGDEEDHEQQDCVMPADDPNEPSDCDNSPVQKSVSAAFHAA